MLCFRSVFFPEKVRELEATLKGEDVGDETDISCRPQCRKFPREKSQHVLVGKCAEEKLWLDSVEFTKPLIIKNDGDFCVHLLRRATESRHTLNTIMWKRDAGRSLHLSGSVVYLLPLFDRGGLGAGSEAVPTLEEARVAPTLWPAYVRGWGRGYRGQGPTKIT